MIKVKKRKILLLPGDGIGPEVISELKKVIKYLNSKNKFLPRPVLLIVFKNCFGIIISVSMFTIGK